MEVAVKKSELYSLIKKAVKEAIHEETADIFLKSISPISTEEMKDINKFYGKPPKNKEVAYSEFMEV